MTAPTPPSPEPQPVVTPLRTAAIFLVVTINAGGEAIARDLLADVSAIQRSVGFRLPEGELSCVAGISATLLVLRHRRVTSARLADTIFAASTVALIGLEALQICHPDDPRMDALWQKAAELHMPISLHVADPIWMYQPMDKHNDGLMNAYEWRLDNQPNIVKLPGMIEILERTLTRHRSTTFIACHFANLDYDLTHLGEVLDRNPNLYPDISARYAETAPIPRFAAQFYARYSDRLLYGTDMGYAQEMYRITFRILESQDEHFYEIDQFGYHWPLYGLGLNDEILKRIYHENAAKLLSSRTA